MNEQDFDLEAFHKTIAEHSAHLQPLTQEQIDELLSEMNLYEYLVMFITATGQLDRRPFHRAAAIQGFEDVLEIERSLSAQIGQPINILNFQLLSSPKS